MDAAVLEWLDNWANRAGFALGRTRLETFGKFGDLLTESNRKFNLTAIADEWEIAAKHFADSLCLAAHVRELRTLWDAGESGGASAARGAAALLDVGAGGGFPGIPLKILLGGALSVTLLDSVGKKAAFMNEAAAALGLCGCAALHARAEDAARRAEMRERFRFVTARALAPLPVLLEYCLPCVVPGGMFIAMKGRRENAERELAQSRKALALLGGRLLRVTEYELEANFPGVTSAENTADAANTADAVDAADAANGASIASDANVARAASLAPENSKGSEFSRTLILIEKAARTPAQYPRRAGTAAKAPL
jgi:16S rRNA (guanine527-N7)-methyltransferase